MSAYVLCLIHSTSYILHHCNIDTTSEKLGVMFGAKPSEKSEEEITELCEPSI